MTIQPFGFDRVFRFASASVEGETRQAALREELETLEARIARMELDHAAELARARADGFEAGLAQARGERDEALLAASDALHASLDGVAQRFETMADEVAAEAASVALLAAEMLAGHAVSLEPERAIREALERALDQVARGTALFVHVHPAMREPIAAMIDARRAGERRALTVTLVEDEALSPGDAHLGWAEGGLQVDAAARRAAVLEELGGLLRAQPEADGTGALAACDRDGEAAGAGESTAAGEPRGAGEPDA